MHAALWLLMWMEIRGSLRLLIRRRGLVRRLLFLLLMLGIGGMFWYARVNSGLAIQSSRFTSAMPFWAFVYLFGTWLSASADRGLVMRPAEIYFLAAGPFPGRDIITLHLVRLGLRSLLGSAVMALMAVAFVPNYVTAWMGMWLMIAVSLLGGMIASLSARRGNPVLVRRARRLFNAAVLVAALLMIQQAMALARQSDLPMRVSTIASLAGETKIGRIVLPPLGWMFAPITCEELFPDAVVVFAWRLLVLLPLCGLVYVLGSDFLEATTVRTDLSLSRRKTMSRGGTVMVNNRSGWVRRIRLPRFPWLGGIGPVSRMQVLHALRILPRHILYTAAIVGLVLVIPMAVEEDRLSGLGLPGWMAGLTLYADFLLLLQLPVGFMSPITQRVLLKTLPIPGWRITMGLMSGAIPSIAAIHLLTLILFAYLAHDRLVEVMVMAVVLVPAAWLLVTNVNLLAAWNLIQPKALLQRDALAVGRAILSIWVFFLMLTPAAAVAAASFAAVQVLSNNWMVSLFCSAMVLLGVSGVYVALAARSFNRWQPQPSQRGQEETELNR